MSGASLGEGVNDYFKDSNKEVYFGRQGIQPILWQDDILCMASSLEEAQAGNIFLSTMIETKLLDFHADKSVCMIIGTGVNVDDMEIK